MVQCKLNLQTDRFNLHKVLIDKLTNILVRGLEIGENEFTNRSVQIQEMNLQTKQFNSKHMPM
jgi:hypothetical protein